MIAQVRETFAGMQIRQTALRAEILALAVTPPQK